MSPSINDSGEPINTSVRHGTYAIEILIKNLLEMGAQWKILEVKIFHGGNLLKGFTVANVSEIKSAMVRNYVNKSRKVSR